MPNIAEGVGEFSPAEKVRFYRMARRSAHECAAILDVLSRTQTMPEDFRASHAELARVVSVLTGLIQRIERRD